MVGFIIRPSNTLSSTLYILYLFISKLFTIQSNMKKQFKKVLEFLQ